MDFDTSTTENFSSSLIFPVHTLRGPLPRLFRRRSRQRSSANAPRGGLEPSSARRLWRANKPPSPVQHRSPRDRHLPSLPRFPRPCSQAPLPLQEPHRYYEPVRLRAHATVLNPLRFRPLGTLPLAAHTRGDSIGARSLPL